MDFIISDKLLYNDTLLSYKLIKNNNDAYVTFKSGIMIYKGNSLTSFIPLFGSNDFLEDGNQILLLQGYQTGNWLRVIMTDILGNEKWKYTLSGEEIKKQIGITKVIYQSDHTGDGIKDVVIVKDDVSSNLSFVPKVILLDGLTGNILSEIDIALPEDDILTDDYETFLTGFGYLSQNIKETTAYNDINNDNRTDFVLSNSLNELYFLDLYNGTIIDYYSHNDLIQYKNKSHYTKENLSNLKLINDINGDSYFDFFQVLYDGTTNFEINYIFIRNNEIIKNKVSELGKTIPEYIKLGDLDFDDIVDYGISTCGIDSCQSRNGSCYRTLQYSISYFYPSNVDVDNDGIKEIFEVSTKNNLIKIRLIDIDSNTILFESEELPFSYTGFMQKAKLSNTFISEGEVLIATGISDGINGFEVMIHELATKKLVETIEVTKELDINKYREFTSIVIVEDNNSIYFYSDYIKSSLGSEKTYEPNDFRTIVYDYTNRNIAFFLNNNYINKIVIKANKVIIQSGNAEIINGSLLNELKITDIFSAGNLISITFENKQSELLYIYVDDVLVETTDKENVDLRLFSGVHTITITTLELNGIGKSISFEIIVRNNDLLPIVIILGSLLILFLLILLPGRSKKYLVRSEVR